MLFEGILEAKHLLRVVLPKFVEGEGSGGFCNPLTGKKNPQLGWRFRRRKTRGCDDLGSNGRRGWQRVRGCSLTDGGNRGRSKIVGRWFRSCGMGGRGRVTRCRLDSDVVHTRRIRRGNTHFG